MTGLGQGLRWLRSKDAGLLALRRSGRAAIVMPALLALSFKVIGNPVMATFAAFGSLAMLLFGMINWMFTWLRPDGSLNHEQMAPLVADLFFGGLAAVRKPRSQARQNAAVPSLTD